MLFSLLTYFSAIMLEATQKVYQSTRCKNVGNYIKICREKKYAWPLFELMWEMNIKIPLNKLFSVRSRKKNKLFNDSLISN